MPITRRLLLQAPLVGFIPRPPAVLTFSIGTYGMKGVALDKAVATIAALGYDGLEIAAMPDTEGEPARLSADRRKELCRLIGERGLRLTALMENLPPAADEAGRKTDLDRLRRVLELARDLGAPLVQTVLGGGAWEEKKNLFRDRLGEWLAAAKEAKIVVAVKPHRGGALSRPDEAVWLIRQLGDPPLLRMVYDYSHYAFRDMPVEETVRTALPVMAHVAVKDAVQKGDKVEFLLPGESGAFDYAALLRQLLDGGYRGDVCCEVSSMIWKRPGYDPEAAAKRCYELMAPAFERARARARR